MNQEEQWGTTAAQSSVWWRYVLTGAIAWATGAAAIYTFIGATPPVWAAVFGSAFAAPCWMAFGAAIAEAWGAADPFRQERHRLPDTNSQDTASAVASKKDSP